MDVVLLVGGFLLLVFGLFWRDRPSVVRAQRRAKVEAWLRADDAPGGVYAWDRAAERRDDYDLLSDMANPANPNSPLNPLHWS